MLLFVTDDRDRGDTVLQGLFSHGVYALQCDYETAEPWCAKEDVGGVILDCISNARKGERLCSSLRVLYPREMPVCAIVADESVTPEIKADRLIRARDLEQLFADLLAFCADDCGHQRIRFSSSELILGERPEETYYMGYRMALSAREHEILRFLLYRAPRLTAKDVLLAACCPTERFSEAGFSALIASLNHRARHIDPRPLIVNVYGKGYRLRDGVLE